MSIFAQGGFASTFWRRMIFWLRTSWPQIVLTFSMLVFFYVLVVPDYRPGDQAETAIAREWQTKFLLVVLGAMVLAGWRICFVGRNYLTTKYIRYLVQSIFLSPVLFGLCVFVLLAYVPQMREIYLVVIDERRFVHGILGLAGIVFLSLLIGCWQRSVGERLLRGLYADHADLTFDRGLGRVLAFNGNLASMLPILGLAAGLFGLLVDATSQVARLDLVDAHLGRQTVGDIRGVVVRLNGLVFALPFVTVPAALLMWLVMEGMRRIVTAGPQVSRSIMLAGGAVGVGCILVPFVFADRTVEAARALGPLAVTSVALIAFASFFSMLSWLSVRLRVPLTGMFVVVLALFLLVPVFAGSGPPSQPSRERPPRVGPAGGLHVAFQSWLESRPDKDRYIKAGKPYPVFIVAASGGGIYAASSAATFLAEVQDDCSTFAQHVFVISGVSGGALGASLFNALAAADKSPATGCQRNTRQTLTDHIEQIVRSDHLSPVVAVLVSDIARKLSTAILREADSGGLDRAEMLQRSFSKAFNATAACRGPVKVDACKPLTATPGLEVPFHEHWNERSKAPGLILNTTWSETGYRVAFAPYPLHANSDGTMFNFGEIATVDAIHRSLIHAAVVSARFPGIVPAWPVLNPLPGGKSGQRWNFVDGGYVDNSGATSALEIYNQLAQYLPPPADASSLYQRKYPPLGMEIDLRLVLLTDAEPELVFTKIHGTGYSDTVAPLKALLQVRSQLANRAITQTINKVEPGIERKKLTAREGNSKVWLVNLEQTVFPLPLGWMISRVSNDIVSYMLGRPDLCKDDYITKPATDPRVQRAVATVVENSCVKAKILELIRAVP